MRCRALASAEPGRVHEEVEHDGRTRDGPGQHEPAAAQAGEPGFGDGGGEAGSNGGVEGVPPAARTVTAASAVSAQPAATAAGMRVTIPRRRRRGGVAALRPPAPRRDQRWLGEVQPARGNIAQVPLDLLDREVAPRSELVPQDSHRRGFELRAGRERDGEVGVGCHVRQTRLAQPAGKRPPETEVDAPPGQQHAGMPSAPCWPAPPRDRGRRGRRAAAARGRRPR